MQIKTLRYNFLEGNLVYVNKKVQYIYNTDVEDTHNIIIILYEY